MAEKKEKTTEQLLAEAMAAITSMQKQMQANAEALEAKVSEMRAENIAAKKEATKAVQDSVDALTAMQNKVDSMNAQDLRKRTAERNARCKKPLSDTEREAWRELERRAKTTGFEEQPGPAEMVQLGEYRIRAKIKPAEESEE